MPERPAVPPARHPDLDTLADLDAGAARRARGRAASRRTSRGAPTAPAPWPRSARVRADLAALPAPPLPDAVAARLDATPRRRLRRGRRPRGRPPPRAAPGTSPGTPRGARPTRRQRGLRDAADGRGPTAAPAASLRRPAGRRRRLRVGGRRRLASPRWSAPRAPARTVPALAAARAESGPDAPAPGGEDPAAGGADATGRGTPASRRTPVRARRDLATRRDAALGAGASRAASGPAGAMADPDRPPGLRAEHHRPRGGAAAVLRIRYEGKPAYAFVFDDGPAADRVRGRRPVRHRRVARRVLDRVS